MTHDPTSFSKEDVDLIMKELENTMTRSQILASQANHINVLQTKQTGLFCYSKKVN
jgi:hypothetical protein